MHSFYTVRRVSSIDTPSVDSPAVIPTLQEDASSPLPNTEDTTTPPAMPRKRGRPTKTISERIPSTKLRGTESPTPTEGSTSTDHAEEGTNVPEGKKLG